jgi:hypothetical protein
MEYDGQFAQPEGLPPWWKAWIPEWWWCFFLLLSFEVSLPPPSPLWKRHHPGFGRWICRILAWRNDKCRQVEQAGKELPRPRSEISESPAIQRPHALFPNQRFFPPSPDTSASRDYTLTASTNAHPPQHNRCRLSGCLTNTTTSGPGPQPTWP